jgi:NAD(P) transhydrogenase
LSYYDNNVFLFISGNALGMIGVSSGIAATVGLLAPTPESFAQMAACIGTGIYI